MDQPSKTQDNDALQGSHDNGTTICRAIVAFHCKNNVPE